MAGTSSLAPCLRKLGVESGGRYRCHDWRCGASLIDSASLASMEAAGYPNLGAASLQGRVVVTAAHCIQFDKASGWTMTDPVNGQIATDSEMIVTFTDEPTWYYDAPAADRDENNCDNVGRGKAFYNVSKAFYNTDFSVNYVNKGGDIGQGAIDFTVLILEQAVTEFTDKALLNHHQLPWFKQYRFRRDFTGGLGAGNVGMAGYGLTYLGDPTKGGVGQPMGVGGGSKVWSILSVLSTNSININGQMVLQQGDNTLCAGDSGSAALVQLLPASAAPTGTTGHVLLGVVHGGNSLCRATNTYTRSDSSKFWTWLATVDRALT